MFDSKFPACECHHLSQMAVMNGTAGAHGGDDYQQWMEGKVAQGKVSPQTQRHGGEVYSNTLPVRKVAPAKSKTTLSKCALNVRQLSTWIHLYGIWEGSTSSEICNKSSFARK